MNFTPENSLPELPRYTLDVQAMDLGPSTKAVGLELIETERREPLRGDVAAGIWAAVYPALANQVSWALDFFSHIERAREYCQQHAIKFREAASHCLVVPQPEAGKLREMVMRFSGETFGVRCGEATKTPDTVLEGKLSQRGLDAYQEAYKRYTYCGICEPDDGWLTLLSETIWASEIIRRARPALKEFDVYIVRPQ